MKKTKMWVKQVLSKTGILDFYIKQLYIKITIYGYKLKHKATRVQPKQFVFESFQGKSATDSPRALYLELLNNLPEGKFIWVFRSNQIDDYAWYANKKNTTCVIRGTREYFQAYASSQYWIVNCRLPYRLIPKSHQVLVQCWHGTPFKKIGLDIHVENHPTSSLRSMHYAYAFEGKRCDYFLSPSVYASTCFKSAFDLKDEQIIELGYPRNDSLFTYKNDKSYQNKIKQLLGIDLKKKVILYAPTFRDDDFKLGKHVAQNHLDNKLFKSQFDDDVQFLFRGHYFSKIDDHQDNFFMDVSNYPCVSDLMLIADYLITDYSSLFFDYLILERPIAFFMYDQDHYLNKVRGVYLNLHNLPGPIVQTQSELLSLLKSNKIHIKDLKHYKKMYNPYENGHSSSNVCRVILNKTVMDINVC